MGGLEDTGVTEALQPWGYLTEISPLRSSGPWLTEQVLCYIKSLRVVTAEISLAEGLDAEFVHRIETGS